jgi:hypothetical protein
MLSSMRQGAIVVGLVLVACTLPMPVGPASELQTPSGPRGGSGGGSSSSGGDWDCGANGDAACPDARVGDGAGDDGTAGDAADASAE